MKFETMDGMLLEAESLRQVAESLWQSAFNPQPTIEEWMRASARRAALWNGSVIRTASPEAHVEDLMTHGFLRKLG